jgi:esterase/lipase superfamily enzyme
MHREYHRWYSPRLHRDMELLIFGHGGARVLVFPTRAGRFYDYENWGLVGALGHALGAGWLQLYCVDSVDAEGLYCPWCHPRDRIWRHEQYEAYILHEVLPLSWACNPNPMLIAHGCSLGAYHAANIALRHPHLFGKIVALSGRYDLTTQLGSFRGLFDGYYDEAIYFHTPCHFVPNLHDQAQLALLRRMEIIFAVGADDCFCENNRQLSQALWEKGVWNALHIWQGEAHRARDWRRMVALYL